VDRRASGKSTDLRYLLRFGGTALLLISGTLLLVLFVLPERYVLSSGFRESGASFPTPATPFVPVPVVFVAARDLPEPPLVIAPGPAEIFWAELGPLLDEGRFTEALPNFENYLRAYPGDRDARREYAITLLAAGRSAEAVDELRRLLAGDDDFERRLLLARTLRELGRTDEAAEEYAALVEASPDDVGLWLEYARVHGWTEDYDAAAEVLRAGLALHPDSVPLRVELARMEFSRDDPEAAGAALAGLDEAALAAEDAIELRDAVREALVIPVEVVEPLPPPTLLELAVIARVDGDFEGAAELFEEALAESPDNIEIWQAYADLLEYELGDLEQARLALLEVEQLGEPDAGLQLRLAQLEIWTARNPEARARLLALLSLVESDSTSDVPPSDVHAMLGDLDRWEGDRVAAARRYQLALDEDPEHQRALDGFSALQAEVARTLVEVEEPRAGASTYALGDTDDFSRLDVGAEWVEVEQDWAWGGQAGSRWLDGLGSDGAPAEVQQGVYVDLEAARWWRWGTLRTAAQFGVQRVFTDWEYSVGGSLQHRAGGLQTEVAYEHGPAYPTTATMQSALLGVVQDHVTVSHSRPLNDRWSLSATAEGAWLRTNLDTLASAQNESTARFGAALSLGRSMSETLTLGLSTRMTGYTGPGPVLTDPVTSAERRLFWDPRLALSAGPYARISQPLSASWTATGMLGPGIALLDERTSSGWAVVPHVSAEAGIRREGSRFWTALDLFYYQGQFDGYRSYGARLTFSARDWSRLGGGLQGS
jgi:tetratricopeptide (TPR) repeat protein